MVIVDTSIWITHLREGLPRLKDLLLKNIVLCHPFIIGELACGDINNRKEILSLLEDLPQPKIASHQQILYFIESKKLMGKGLGFIDMHLLASAYLSKVLIWTEDNKLRGMAEHLHLL